MFLTKVGAKHPAVFLEAEAVHHSQTEKHSFGLAIGFRQSSLFNNGRVILLDRFHISNYLALIRPPPGLAIV